MKNDEGRIRISNSNCILKKRMTSNFFFEFFIFKLDLHLKYVQLKFYEGKKINIAGMLTQLFIKFKMIMKWNHFYYNKVKICKTMMHPRQCQHLKHGDSYTFQKVNKLQTKIL